MLLNSALVEKLLSSRICRSFI